jgi:hypothetical protein
MSKLLFRLERKYGKYAISNLSLILVMCYVAGYIFQYLVPMIFQGVSIIEWISLNPYKILHGQVWRLFTWILIPPRELDFWTLIMLYFYYSIGKTMESVWGDFRYNVYIFSGILFTIIGAFVVYGFAYLQFSDMLNAATITAEDLFGLAAYMKNGNIVMLPGYWFNSISTYFICMSIFLAFAATFPDTQVLLLFIIPIRVKILGIVYGAFLAFTSVQSLVNGQWYVTVNILMSLLNFILFFFGTRDLFGKFRPSDMRRKANYRKSIRWAQVNAGNEATHNGKSVITRHKCAICGRTELDGDIEFRFCTKCDGNYEYCMDHLYTHEHVKRI